MVKIGRRSETLAGHMAPVNLQGEQLHRLVRQALARVGDEAQCEQILHAALVADGSHDVPQEIGRFAAFVFGALHKAIAETIDDEAAATVSDSLDKVVNAQLMAQREQQAVGDPEQVNVPTILVVDSDIAVRGQLVQLLKTMEYNAVSAPDANIALAMCVRYEPDVVISEMSAGEDGGKQLAALLRVAFGGDAPPLIIVVPEDEAALEFEDAAAVLQKPVQRSDLEAAVTPLLDADGDGA